MHVNERASRSIDGGTDGGTGGGTDGVIARNGGAATLQAAQHALDEGVHIGAVASIVLPALADRAAVPHTPEHHVPNDERPNAVLPRCQHAVVCVQHFDPGNLDVLVPAHGHRDP